MSVDRLLRKLSESRGVNLPEIKIYSQQKVGYEWERFSESVPYIDDENGNFDMENSALIAKNIRLTSPITNSPVDYTLRHLNDNLQKLSSADAAKPITPTYARINDSLDVTIYLADGRGFKFSIVGGKLATASNLLILMANHLHVNPELLSDTCALWMVSKLLEVQLKPKHNPYDVRKHWMHFLSRFTFADEDEKLIDEPLLVLQRNVQLSVAKEIELENKYSNERITEILFASAKHAVLGGRYICDLDLSIQLAALQMAAEVKPSESDLEMLKLDIHHYFPMRHRRSVKSLCVFGFPIIGCKGLESRILSVYHSALNKYSSIHECRMAYLSLVRELPFYGCAFFHGRVERSYGNGSFKDLKKMLLAATLPDIEVVVGINRSYVAIIDEIKQESLLLQPLEGCSWKSSEIGDEQVEGHVPYFLFHFPYVESSMDASFFDDKCALRIPERTKLLQIFSKQAVMMKALITSLCELTLQDNPNQISNDGNSHSAIAQSLDEEDGKIEEKLLPYSSRISKTTDGKTNFDELRHTASRQHDEQNQHKRIEFLRRNYRSSLNKLCSATFDSSGQCLDAQGSLRILQQVV